MVLVAGVVWGLIQSALLWLFIFPIDEQFSEYIPVLWTGFEQAPVQAFFWSSLILAVLFGLWIEDLKESFVATVLCQVIAFLAGPFVAIDYVANENYLDLFAVDVVLALLLIGVVGSFVGGFLSERVQPARTHLIGWPAFGFGLLFDAIALSISMWHGSVTLDGYPTYFAPAGLVYFTLPVMGAVALTGVAFFILGLVGKNAVSTDRVALLGLAAAFVFGFSLISISAENSLGEFFNDLVEELLSVTILLLSLATMLASLSSQQVEGIDDTLGSK